jgi:hypothetical protein
VRHVRMLGLCLAAIIAVVAFTASSAFAGGPEWGKCEAKAGGKYADANCQTKAKKGSGAYEWLKANQVAAKRKAEGSSGIPGGQNGVPFSGAAVGSGGVLQTYFRECELPFESRQLTRAKCKEEHGTESDSAEDGSEATRIECENEGNDGEAVGKNTVKNVDVVFTGCKLFGSIPCSNTATEGSVQVNPLQGTLGWINKAEKKVGLLLEPIKKHGEFARFNCGGFLETVVGVGNSKAGAEYTTSGCKGAKCVATPSEEKNGGYDGIISPIGPINTMTTEFTQVFTVNAVGENQPTKLEGNHIDLLEDYIYNPSKPGELPVDWSAAGEEITNTNKSCRDGTFLEVHAGKAPECPGAIGEEFEAGEIKA